jgi:hypothetical protein
MTFTKSKVLIIGRRYSRNVTKVCHINKLRDPFFIHAATCTRGLAASGFFRFVLAGRVTRYIILGCM